MRSDGTHERLLPPVLYGGRGRQLVLSGMAAAGRAVRVALEARLGAAGGTAHPRRAAA